MGCMESGALSVLCRTQVPSSSNSTIPYFPDPRPALISTIQTHVPTCPPCRTTCTLAAMLYTNATPGYYAPPVSVAVGMIQATLSGIIAAAGGRDAFAVKYRRTLNWQAPQALDPSGSAAPAPSSGSSGLSPRAVTAVAVAVPCGVVLVGAVVLMAVWSGRSRGRKALVNAPPGAGPLTTLLVSDIQSSTK